MDSRLQSGTAAPARIVSPYGPQGLSSAKAQEFRVTEAGVADQMARITKNHGALSGVPRPASTASGPASASKPWMTPTELLAHVKNTQESDASSSDDDSTIADEVPDDGASFPLVVGDMSAPEELGPLHQAADGRPYIKFQGPNGTLEKGYGALFPAGYRLHDDPAYPYICPVRECRLIFPMIQALGGHFGAQHRGKTFNDNGDGTLSQKGSYSNPSPKTSPAIVITRNPLPSNALPPKQPSLPLTWPPKPAKKQTPVPLPRFGDSANAHRHTKAPHWGSASHLQQHFAPSPAQANTPRETPVPPPKMPQKPSIPPAATLADSEAVSFLNGFLDPEQNVPNVSIVRYLARLPLQRDLPEAWLSHHVGMALDPVIYTCALAYIVGDEVKDSSRCSGLPGMSTARLSERCITLPQSIPDDDKRNFSKTPTCVGCKYYSFLQRQVNKCRFHKEFLADLQKPDFADGMDVDLEDSASGRPDSESQRSGSAESIPAEKREVPMRGRKRRASAMDHPNSAISSGSQTRAKDTSAALQLEEWELAPGRFPTDGSGETFAWSGAYMTSHDAITVADEVGVNVEVVKPGYSKRWGSADNKLRICYVAQGKLNVRVGSKKLEIGRRGTFKIAPGNTCIAENRQYDDAEISCTTIYNYELRAEDNF